MMDDLFAGQNQNDILLNRMIQLFNDARDSMKSDEFSISNIFDAPNKNEIVRLNQKAKTFVETNNWLTPFQATEQVEVWKVHTLNQSTDPLTRQANSQKIVLSLFDGQDIYAILAACPCTDFAGSGARHFAAKDLDGRTEASIEQY